MATKKAVKKTRSATKATTKTVKSSTAKSATNDKVRGRSNGNREKVLRLVCRKEGTLADLAKNGKMERRTVYHHVYHLREDGLVTPLDIEGVREWVWSATSAGKKLNAKTK